MGRYREIVQSSDDDVIRPCARILGVRLLRGSAVGLRSSQSLESEGENKASRASTK